MPVYLVVQLKERDGHVELGRVWVAGPRSVLDGFEQLRKRDKRRKTITATSNQKLPYKSSGRGCSQIPQHTWVMGKISVCTRSGISTRTR